MEGPIHYFAHSIEMERNDDASNDVSTSQRDQTSPPLDNVERMKETSSKKDEGERQS
jgi:hypothetical protein